MNINDLIIQYTMNWYCTGITEVHMQGDINEHGCSHENALNLIDQETFTQEYMEMTDNES